MLKRLGCWMVLVCLAGACSGCGVLYTVVKSESKLDRLAVPMTKAEVIEQIGRPDRVLRDDGRLLVWEYSLTARKQWLYELALCPVSVWIGGCIFYPFTNIAAEHQREYPYHIVLVNDELCAWGAPSAILQRRRACASSGTAALGSGGMLGRPEPVVTGVGPINRGTIDRYRTMAVMLFEDAPGVPGSGSRVAGIVTTLLLDLDMNMVERAKLDEVLKEQVIQLTHADDANVLKVGKLVGAQAIVVGELQQWERIEGDQVSRVSLALRMIDVESGLLLFNGEGHGSDATVNDPEGLARVIVHRILARFGSQTGLLGSGRIGVNWDLQESAGARYYLVRELRSSLPAEKAGLKVGDRVVACNGAVLSSVSTAREAKRLCHVDAGQTLQLDVRRASEPIAITLIAEKRPGL
ncbi:MAG: PDZ domain-containing protein [Nitrospirota bacterium]|nr:PDZ domain-containing protein [Nitrospirota bacterium]MDP2382545.1 PDZ domain-containing protein [Nitrospirota bacterium]